VRGEKRLKVLKFQKEQWARLGHLRNRKFQKELAAPKKNFSNSVLRNATLSEVAAIYGSWYRKATKWSKYQAMDHSITFFVSYRTMKY
jgi:hypothetical protein